MCHVTASDSRTAPINDANNVVNSHNHPAPRPKTTTNISETTAHPTKSIYGTTRVFPAPSNTSRNRPLRCHITDDVGSNFYYIYFEYYNWGLV
jgi:hypothetical protein